MPYKVLIVIKDKWWTDGKPLKTFAAACRHRTKVARRWNTSETAIHAPDGRVLAFRESLEFEKMMKNEGG